MLNGFLASIFGERINSTRTEKKSDSPVENLKNNSVDNVGTKRFFLSADNVLSTDQSQYCMTQIKEIAGLSDEAFDAYYLPAIRNFAVLCQDIGASERYHHAYPFGLIEHSLEVAMYAMRRCQGCIYHPDGHVESIQWLERVFMYVVFCSALLHDGGKIFTNFQWKIKTKDGKWANWTPLLHSVPEEEEKVEYRTTPMRNKNGINVFLKHSHEIFSSHLILEVLPKKGIEWIFQFSNEYAPELFIHFIHALNSDYDNADDVGLCVKLADQKSTNDAIKRQQLSSGAAFVDFDDPNLPLHESIKSILGSMFNEPDQFHLQVNKVAMGKFSHIERFGDLLFVSAKSVVPIVMKHLKEKNVKLPNEQAVYSLLTDNGVSLTSPSGDTLWWVEFFSHNNKNKSKEISYLVFKVADFPSTTISDLSEIGVDFNISVKTLGEKVEQQDSIEATLFNLPSLYALFYPNKPQERADKQKESQPSIPDKATQDESYHRTEIPDPAPNNGKARQVKKTQQEQMERTLPTTTNTNEKKVLENRPITSADDLKKAVLPKLEISHATQNSTTQSASPRSRLSTEIESLTSSPSSQGIKPISNHSNKPSVVKETATKDNDHNVGVKPKLTPINHKKASHSQHPQKDDHHNDSKTDNVNNTRNKKKTSSVKKTSSSNESKLSIGLNKALGLRAPEPEKKPKAHETSKPQEAPKYSNDIQQEDVQACYIPESKDEVSLSNQFPEIKIKIPPVRQPIADLEDALNAITIIPFNAVLDKTQASYKSTIDLLEIWFPYMTNLVKSGSISLDSVVTIKNDGFVFNLDALYEALDESIYEPLKMALTTSHLTKVIQDGSGDVVDAFSYENGVSFKGVGLATRDLDRYLIV